MSYFQVITTMLTTNTDDLSLTGVQVIIKVLGHQYQWLVGGYDLEIGLLEMASMVVSWWLVAFLCSDW